MASSNLIQSTCPCLSTFPEILSIQLVFQVCNSPSKPNQFLEFPGSPVVRTWCFRCRGPGFNP